MGHDFLICLPPRMTKFDDHDLTIYAPACHHSGLAPNHNSLANQDSAHAQEKSCEKNFGQR